MKVFYCDFHGVYLNGTAITVAKNKHDAWLQLGTEIDKIRPQELKLEDVHEVSTKTANTIIVANGDY